MPATFTSKPQSDKWSVKYDLTKTTGKTVYLIYASEPTTPITAATWFLANVAHVGSNYPSAAGWLPCREIDVQADDQTRMLFRAECGFDNSNQTVESPLSIPTAYEYDEETYEEAYFEDEDDTPNYAKHTNGVPFSELPKRDNSVQVITVTKNVAATGTMATYGHLRRKVNSAAVSIDGDTFPERTVRVAKLSLSKTQTLNGVDFKTLTAVIKVKEDTWDQRFESLGLVEISTEGIDWPIVDADGHPVTEPWPLDADGAAKASRSDPGQEIVLKPYVSSADIGDLT